LEDAIRSGQLRPGDRVPGERELAEQLGVSRVTVRRAFAELASRGVLQGEPRRGWFVPAHADLTDLPLLTGFGELAAKSGLRSSANVLHCATRPATIDEAELFTIAPGMEIFELHRLHRLEGLAHSLNHAITPLAYAPALADTAFDQPGASLLQTLERAVGGISHAEHLINAIGAEPETAKLLDMQVGQPVLRIYERIYDLRGRLVQCTDSRTRGDRGRRKTIAFRRIPEALDVKLLGNPNFSA
jgi:DNA-binding GntR family transcriptional regulator